MKIIYSLRTAIFYDVVNVKRNDVGVYGEQEMHRSTLIKKKKGRERKIRRRQEGETADIQEITKMEGLSIRIFANIKLLWREI